MSRPGSEIQGQAGQGRATTKWPEIIITVGQPLFRPRCRRGGKRRRRVGHGRSSAARAGQRRQERYDWLRREGRHSPCPEIAGTFPLLLFACVPVSGPHVEYLCRPRGARRCRGHARQGALTRRLTASLSSSSVQDLSTSSHGRRRGVCIVER